MADEITLSLDIRAEKDNIDMRRRVSNFKADMEKSAFTWQTQDIGTSHESLDVSTEVDAPGYAWFRNLDDTNYVEVGLDVSSTFHALLRLGPGEPAILPVSTTDLYAQANTANVNLEYMILSSSGAT